MELQNLLPPQEWCL